ncbi:hypothetical protein GCM10022252_23580 [Streptosporangium oxazolinicum]|uniref:AAA+ ATPase domain-containing protein n=1 Tax=Streptosporangium oxazolinicum TaxID=909287 RepID=A0ABP8AQX5_9ACTN
MSPPTIRLEPLVSWPQTMTVGQEYLVTVDLRLAEPGDEWPYQEEEFAFSCMLDGGERIAVESVDDISVILHRFGGTYGPARFIVTALGDTGDHQLWLSLSTQRGATVRTDPLPVRITALASGEEDRHLDLRTVPEKPRQERLSGEEGSWVAAIHLEGDPVPVSAGVLVDDGRVLTCAHALLAGSPPTGRLWITFPRANRPAHRYGASVAPRTEARLEISRSDLAVLVLREAPPPEVLPAPVRLNDVDDLVGRRWSAAGLPDREGRSVVVKGVIDPAPAHGNVTLTADPGHRLDPGLSGAAVWSPGYGAVIGMVLWADGPGSGVAITMREVDALLPGRLREGREGRPDVLDRDRLAPVRAALPPDHGAGSPDDPPDDQAARDAAPRRKRADVILAVEMSGRSEAVLRRRRLAAATIEELAARYPGEVNVAIVGYTYHDFSRGGDGHRPVVTGSWLEPAENALTSLANLTSTSERFPGAAPLEDALHYIDRHLPFGAPGRPVVLLVLARQPPHPARASRGTALPCPHRYDHQQLTGRLAERGVRLMTVIDDTPDRASPHLRRLGADHSVELQWTEPDALVDAMAIQHLAPARRPAGTPGTTPRYAPAPEPGRRVRRVGLLGPAGSGKTTFLAALNVALLLHDSGLSLLGANPAAADQLVTLTGALVQERRFPSPDTALDDTDLMILGSRSSRGFLGMGRRETGVRLHLGVMDTSGGPREDMTRWLTACDDLVYLFDPLREPESDDIYDFFLSTLPRLGRDLDATGRLPQRLAVCVTKFDDFKIMETAKRMGLLTTDPEDPFGFPRVVAEDAKELFQQLCRISADGNTDIVPNAIARFFHEDRTRYFVTSSIGFYAPRNGPFTMDDYQNLIPTGSGDEVRIRGEVRPINVLEPFLWLARP